MLLQMPLRHHSLVAWQRADDLFVELHRLTRTEFPAFERFELGGQLRRAAYSVAANIVEGFARRHSRARGNFLNISESSLAEVGYCLHVAERLGYISAVRHQELELQVRRVAALRRFWASFAPRGARLVPSVVAFPADARAA